LRAIEVTIGSFASLEIASVARTDGERWALRSTVARGPSSCHRKGSSTLGSWQGSRGWRSISSHGRDRIRSGKCRQSGLRRDRVNEPWPFRHVTNREPVGHRSRTDVAFAWRSGPALGKDLRVTLTQVGQGFFRSQEWSRFRLEHACQRVRGIATVPCRGLVVQSDTLVVEDRRRWQSKNRRRGRCSQVAADRARQARGVERRTSVEFTIFVARSFLITAGLSKLDRLSQRFDHTQYSRVYAHD
jgi:hypothetical protein